MPEDPFATADERPSADRGRTGCSPGRAVVRRAGVDQLAGFRSKDGEGRDADGGASGEDVRVSSLTAGSPPTVVSNNATIVDTFRSGMAEKRYAAGVREPGLRAEPAGDVREGCAGKISRGNFFDDSDQVEGLRKCTGSRETTADGVSGKPVGRSHLEEKQGTLLAAVAVESAI